MVAAWERQCQLVPGAALYRHDGLVVAVGSPGGPSAAVVLVEETPVDPRHGLETAEALCAAHAAPVAVEVAAGAHPRVEAALVEAGFRPGLRRPAMVAALSPEIAPPGAAPPAGLGAGAAGAAVAAGAGACASDRPGRPISRRCGDSTRPASACPPPWPPSCCPPPPSTTRRAGRSWPRRPRRRVGPGTRSWWPRRTAIGTRRSVGVTGVATEPAARGAGLATAVVAELLAIATAQGIRGAWLVAEPGATTLYRRLGFQPAGDWLTWAKT